MAGHPGTLIQITPADGWYAEYKGRDGLTFFTRIACWGLFQIEGETSGATYLGGLDPDPMASFEPASELDNFIRYVHRDDMTEEEMTRIGG